MEFFILWEHTVGVGDPFDGFMIILGKKNINGIDNFVPFCIENNYILRRWLKGINWWFISISVSSWKNNACLLNSGSY